ncbi:MAG: VWA domain-containing protein [Candidatus Hodarchaeota archaeon]
MRYEDFFTPRIVLLSDGEADSKTAWQTPLNIAKNQGICIDVVALLSQHERGRSTLEKIARDTSGNFILPDDINKFISEFVRLSKKKHASKVEDIVLLLDVSGSMSERYRNSSKKKIRALKDAVLEFAEKKLSIDPRDRVGVVLFGTRGHAKVEVALTPRPYNRQMLDTKVIPRLIAQNGTPLAMGLNLALSTLNLPNKKANFRVQVAQPINSIDYIPGRHGTCKYCHATNKPNPAITPETWAFYEGVRKVMVFRCPSCGMLYHGMCFDKHVTKGGNAGVCYGCNAVLSVEGELRVQTPQVERTVYMCPKCNESLPADARFCSNCGFQISGQMAQAQQPIQSSISSGASASASGQAFYNPEAEELTNCLNCGYSCQAEWDSCPMCNRPLPKKKGGPGRYAM